MRTILLAFATAVALSHSASAQQCGDPPRVDDQTLKGEIDGRAKFLSSFIGDAGLKGQVEMARTDIFSKYPHADKVHSDTYLLYMLCSFVMSDPKLSAQEKLSAILEVRKVLNAPSPPASSSSITTTAPQSPAIKDTQGNVTIQYGSPPTAPK
jgi:hypothetical protein